jgi:hypothetical protein
MATEHNCAVLDGKKNGWIPGNGCVLDDGTGGVMEQDDGWILEGKPCFIEGATPVAD